MKENSKLITFFSIVIGLVLLIVLGIVVRNIIFPNADKSNTEQVSTAAEAGATSENPIIVSETDLALTTEEFSSKYAGKYIGFNGLIQGTSTLRGAPSSHTMLVIGDNINSGSFADGSAFWITSGSTTFSQDLQAFAVDNSSPYETGNYPKVKVVAKVAGYSEDYMVAQLEPIVNVNGETPSVTSR